MADIKGLQNLSSSVRSRPAPPRNTPNTALELTCDLIREFPASYRVVKDSVLGGLHHEYRLVKGAA